MTDLQVGIIFLTGIVSGIVVFLINNTRLQNLLFNFFIALLGLAVFFNLALLTGTLLMSIQNPILRWLISTSPHKIIIFFFDGLIIGYFLLTLILSSQKWLSISDRKRQLLNILIAAVMASYFISTGIEKIPFFNSMLAFLKQSGYNAAMLYFIITIEVICGAGLLFKRTALICAAILILEMLGATYTHYHNYFAYHIPDPFSNSIDSLKMQPFLLMILFRQNI